MLILKKWLTKYFLLIHQSSSMLNLLNFCIQQDFSTYLPKIKDHKSTFSLIISQLKLFFMALEINFCSDNYNNIKVPVSLNTHEVLIVLNNNYIFTNHNRVDCIKIVQNNIFIFKLKYLNDQEISTLSCTFPNKLQNIYSIKRTLFYILKPSVQLKLMAIIQWRECYIPENLM